MHRLPQILCAPAPPCTRSPVTSGPPDPLCTGFSVHRVPRLLRALDPRCAGSLMHQPPRCIGSPRSPRCSLHQILPPCTGSPPHLVPRLPTYRAGAEPAAAAGAGAGARSWAVSAQPGLLFTPVLIRTVTARSNRGAGSCGRYGRGGSRAGRGEGTGLPAGGWGSGSGGPDAWPPWEGVGGRGAWRGSWGVRAGGWGTGRLAPLQPWVGSGCWGGYIRGAQAWQCTHTHTQRGGGAVVQVPPPLPLMPRPSHEGAPVRGCTYQGRCMCAFHTRVQESPIAPGVWQCWSRRVTAHSPLQWGARGCPSPLPHVPVCGAPLPRP